LFPNGEIEFWVTEKLFEVGDKITHNGQTLIVTSLRNFHRDGKALAVTVRLDGDSQSHDGTGVDGDSRSHYGTGVG
jgi:hypothetical protein